jgi:hypothetical protein
MKKQLLISAVCGLLLGLIAVPALAQSGEVGIDTAPYLTNKAIYFDANLDGTDQPEELIGNYDVYNVLLPFNFHWSTVAGAEYYRVSLIQYVPPGKGAPAASHEIKIAHHSASDPNGPRFRMSVGDGPVCVDCVTVVQVVPETMSLGADGVTYVYTELAGKQVSGPFVFEYPPRATRSGSGSGAFGPVCGDDVCTQAESNEAALHWCPADCQQN